MKKNGSVESENPETVPDHVKKLLDQRKQKESTPKDDAN
jgi:hypothetical protein